MGEPTRDPPSLPEGHAWFGLWIEPLDPLFFRDGRPFNAATRAQGGLPQPRTLAGAIRTAILSARGFNFNAFAKCLERGGVPIKDALASDPAAPEHLIEAAFRGPWLARWDRLDSRAAPLLPAPANLYRVPGYRKVTGTVWSPEGWIERTRTMSHERDEIFRADPLPDGIDLPGWGSTEPERGRRPLWRREPGKPQRVDGYLTLEGIAEFLKGRKPQVDKDPSMSHLVSPCQLYAFDFRVGVAIEAESLTSADSQLFATRLISLRENVGFYVEMSWPAGLRRELEAALSAPFPFGGEGRHAHAKLMRQAVRWPEVAPAAGGVSVYLLVTAGIFSPAADSARGPLDPDRLRDAGTRMLAAASTGPIAVSGWDVARRRPRPTRFAAPAGTVYFAQNSNVPGQVSLCRDSELVAEGWGFALRGVIADDR